MIPVPKKALLGFALLCVGVGVGGLISLSVLRKPAPAAAPAKPEVNWQREREELTLKKEEAEKNLTNTASELQEVKNDRMQLLDRIKQLMKEKDDLAQERDQLLKAMAVIEPTVNRSAQEITRLKNEVEAAQTSQRVLQQQLEAKTAVPAPAAPGSEQIKKMRAVFSKEEKEIRKDMEFIFERERQKLKQEAESLRQKITQLQNQLLAADRKSEDLNRQLVEAQRNLKEAQKEKTHLEQEWSEKLKDAQTHETDALKKAEKGWADRLKEIQNTVRTLQAKVDERRVTEEQLRSSVTRDWAKLYVRLGTLETRQGNFKEAENAFKQAIFLQPISGIAHYNLGVLYDDYMQRPDLAIREYEQYLLLTPNAQDAKTVQGWLQHLRSSVSTEREKDAWNRPGPSGLGKTLKQMLF